MKWKIVSEKKEKEIKQLIKILLENRGLKTTDEVEEFLHPKLENVTFQSVGIDSEQVKKTIKRIQIAIEKNEKIVIFGDYDVDGICGTAILWETLYQQYKNVVPYIPDRFEEGYGLSKKGIDGAVKKFNNPHPNPLPKGEGNTAIGLIITVDNGIVAYEAVEYAKSLGIDVVITDHHVSPAGGGEKELECYALVHTTKLCGTGVAYLLSKEFQISNFQFPISNSSSLGETITLNREQITNNYLDLVTLATVADLVPLTGANRTLVKIGLDTLNKTHRIGLQELFLIAGIIQKKIGVYEIGHVIGPRLNAAGRLFSAMDALRLICTKNPAKAKQLALNLQETNKERQMITEETTEHAISNFQFPISSFQKILLVAHETYNEGIIGLVASRLVERHYRPSFVIAKGEKVSKGSARSISGVNIIEMIRSVSEHVIQAGGHPMAAGFTIETEKIELFQRALELRAEELIQDEHLERQLKIDMELDFSDITDKMFEALQDLGPYGMGNPEPTFLTKGVIIEEIKPVGTGAKHLKLNFKCQISNIKLGAIAFGIGERIKEFKVGKKVDVVYTIAEDTWNSEKKGERVLQLKVRDIKV